jgi:PAS domain S-box-containing protein
LPNSDRTSDRAGRDDDERRETSRRLVLADAAEQLAQIASWDWDLETNELLWSDNHYRLMGLEPGEITPTLEYVFEHAHPDDRERLETGIHDARDAGDLSPWEYRLVRADGVVRHFHSRQAVVEERDGRLRRMVGTTQDITDRRRAEGQIAAHVAVADALVGWGSIDTGGERLLRGLAEAMDFAVGALWIPRGDALVARVAWRPRAADELFAELRDLRVPSGVGVAGSAWKSREPVQQVNLWDRPAQADQPLFLEGIRGALAIPALRGQEVVAVLAFGSREEVDLSERLMRSLVGIGYEVGEFLSRRRGELSPPELTPREIEVLQLAGQGCTGPMIAERLVVSTATVRTHFGNIYRKYGVSDRVSAVAKALREGLIE